MSHFQPPGYLLHYILLKYHFRFMTTFPEHDKRVKQGLGTGLVF